jgi:hypothetical protein
MAVAIVTLSLLVSLTESTVSTLLLLLVAAMPCATITMGPWATIGRRRADRHCMGSGRIDGFVRPVNVPMADVVHIDAIMSRILHGISHGTDAQLNSIVAIATTNVCIERAGEGHGTTSDF